MGRMNGDYDFRGFSVLASLLCDLIVFWGALGKFNLQRGRTRSHEFSFEGRLEPRGLFCLAVGDRNTTALISEMWLGMPVRDVSDASCLSRSTLTTSGNLEEPDRCYWPSGAMRRPDLICGVRSCFACNGKGVCGG